MKTKIIIISLIIFLLSLSVASAADNTTLVKDQTPIKAIEKSDCTYKTYEDLKQAIETSKNGDTIKLTHDLIHYDDYNGFEKTPKITINHDNLVIDGQCHTIDGNQRGISK
ncbi:MAG: hypothetical protein PUD86_06135 [Methanobacteriaceae archaeon]|nr:hypothetical protein [Methanobacteriaceae archaeon]